MPLGLPQDKRCAGSTSYWNHYNSEKCFFQDKNKNKNIFYFLLTYDKLHDILDLVKKQMECFHKKYCKITWRKF